MWIFTVKGAVSIVEDLDNSGFLWVRSRTKGHIEKLFPGYKVSNTPKADYAYRTKVPRSEVSSLVLAQVEDIDYPNFKNAIIDDPYHSACSKVWSAFMNACGTGMYAIRSGIGIPKTRKRKVS